MMDAVTRQACLKEVKILQNVEHPNIVKCFKSFIQASHRAVAYAAHPTPHSSTGQSALAAVLPERCRAQCMLGHAACGAPCVRHCADALCACTAHFARGHVPGC